MKPDWDNLNLDASAIAFLRKEYESVEATLLLKSGEAARAMRGILARIELQAMSGAVGDQPDEIG